MVPLRSLSARWTLALLAPVAAALVNVPLQQALGGRGPLLPFIFAISLVGLLAGWVPASATSLGSAAILLYLWMPPAGSLQVKLAQDRALMVVFVGAACIAGAAGAYVRKLLLDQQDVHQRRLRSLEAGRMAAWEWDLASGKVRTFGEARALFGSAPTRIEQACALCHPDDVERGHRTVREALASGSQFHLECRMKRQDTGELRWVEAYGHVERDTRGRAHRVTGVIKDVTERRLALESARAARKRFEVALRGNDILAWECDARFRCTWAYNPALGYSQADIVGKDLSTLLPRAQYPLFVDALERVMCTGESVRLPLWVEHGGERRHYISNIEALKDEEGRIAGLIGASIDITGMRRTEVALEQSEALYRTLGEAAPDFMWSVDPAGRILYVNQRWRDYTGMTPEALNEQGWSSLVHADDRADIEARWAEAIRRGEVAEAEYRFRKHDGSYRWLLARAVPMKDKDGNVYQWVGTSTDITERRNVQEALEREGRRKDAFLATLAHELRNPMAPIRYALAMLREDAPPAVRQKALDVIHRQAEHMARLLDDLLDMSRISRNVIELQVERVDICRLALQAAETTRALVSQQGHELHVSLPPTGLWVDGDATRLAQVFGNLLDNAAKYTDRGGSIELKVEPVEGHVEVSVQDSGLGLTPEMQHEVFELFTQVHKRTHGSRGGLGIGLAVVKQLVELHGGTVRVHSEGLGRGSRFTVALPRVAAPQSLVEPLVADGLSLPQGTRVLVVDDNGDAADTLALLLRQSGCQVWVAYTGYAALDAFSEHHPQLVVLDIGLPDISGHEVARHIRASPDGADVRLVAVSGWGQEADRERSVRAGFEAHLVKPVDPGLLQRTVAELMSLP